MKTNSLKRRLLPVALAAVVLAGCGRESPEELLASAQAYLAKNDSAAAVIQLKNALQANPDLAEARLLLGQALLAGGDAAGAQTELRKAAELGVAPERVVPLLVLSELRQGRAKEVTTQYAGTTLATPQAQAELRTLLARAWREQGDMAAFEKALGEALKAQPDHAPALLEQARLKTLNKDAPGAVALLDGLLAREPGNADALQLKGDILLYGQRDTTAAQAAYEAALAARPNFADAQGGVVRSLMAARRLDDAGTQLDKLAQMAPGRPQTLYLQGQLAMARNQPAQAREPLQQLLRLTPDNPMALELAGAAELALNNPAQAEALLSRALRGGPDLAMARRLLVSAYVRTGQPDRAVAALPPNLLTQGSDAALLTVAGQAYLLKGQPEEAQRHFVRAAQLDPNDAAKRTSVAVSQFVGGKTELALAALHDIAANDEGVSADLALINAHLSQRKVDEALKAIDALQKKRPNDPLPWMLRGRALMVRNDAAQARQAFERAQSLDANYFAATAALTALDVSQRQFDAARQRLKAVVDRDPKNVQALLAQAEVQSAAGDSREDVQATLRAAVQAAPGDKLPRQALIEHLLRQRNNAAALTEAQAALQALPDTPELVDLLGRAQLANGEQNQALASFGKLQTLMPDSPMPHLRLAGVHMAKQDPAAAIAALRKALQIQPDLLVAQRALADAAMRSNQASVALEVARTVQKQRPREAAGYVLEGDVQMASRNAPAGINAFRNALRVAATPEGVIKLANALHADKQSAEADRLTADWIRNQPRDPVVPMYLADRALGGNRLPDAARHYERVISLQPNNALALNNLAWVAGQLGRADAVQLAEKANQAAPNQPAFMDTLAMLLSERNEHARALEIQKRVVALQPQTHLFKLNLAKMHIKAGDKAAARPLLDELHALGERFQARAEVERLRNAL